MTLVLSGSVAYDYIMTFPGHFREHILVDKLESLSLSFLVESLTRQRGGVAPNIAYTLSLLGERPILMATVGEDFGEYRAWLEANGIDTTGLRTIPGVMTASYFVSTDQAQAQIASFYPGAMAHAAALRLADLPERPARVVISPDSPDAMRERVRECKALAIPYAYDPSQQIIRLTAEDLLEGIECCSLLVVNEYEMGMICNKTGLSEARLLELAGAVVKTCGENGACIHAAGETHTIPAVAPHRLVDPTGVGDAFRGGLFRGIAAGWPWELSGRVGALAATFCLEQLGTQNHRFTRPEFVTRFREHFDDGGRLDELLGEGDR